MPGPLSDARAQAIADKAVAWANRVNKASVRAKDRDRAALLAKKNYEVNEYLSRIAVSDMARDILRAVNRAIRAGEIPKKWANGEGPEALSAVGLDKFDKRKLFQTSFRKAQAAGEFEYAAENDDIVYLMYCTQRDSRVRESHRKRDRVCLPKGHDWFKRGNTPPLDPNCRCYLKSLTRQMFTDLLAEGDALQTDEPQLRMVRHRNKVTGETVTLPEGVAPGFDIDPSSPDAVERYRKLLEQRVKALLEAEPGGI